MIKRIILLVFMLTSFNQWLVAQQRPINNLCYTENFTERISISSDVDFNTLSFLDKLKFNPKSYTKTIHEYINENRMPTSDASMTSTENIFPEWYTNATTIRTDETGTKSFFTKDSKYHVDGWVGSTVSSTERGEYIEDVSTGQRYLHTFYTEESKSYYKRWVEIVRTHGYLYKHYYRPPTEKELSLMSNKGFETTTNKYTTTARSNTRILIWDHEKKIFVRQLLAGGTVVKTVKTYYEYNEIFKDYLISHTLTITPGIFSNGDCYETLTQINYSDYNDSCGSPEITKRSNGEDTAELVKDLTVFPNPSSDRITCIIPDIALPAIIKVYSMNGDLIYERNTKSAQAEATINISDYPQGMYMLKLTQATSQYSTTFIKQ